MFALDNLCEIIIFNLIVCTSLKVIGIQLFEINI